MRTFICIAGVAFLGLLVGPQATASGPKDPAPSRDYVMALNTANLFLAAWVERAPDAGLALISGRILAKAPDSARVDLRSGLRQYVSGLSNPRHEAFEIVTGTSIGPNRFVFPVRLFELYAGWPAGHVFIDTLGVVREGGEWRVDRLPRTYDAK